MRVRRFLPISLRVVLAFATAIAVGAVLLSLRAATKDRIRLPFVDALFTSTSAVCVTGLTVRDTARDFSGFGQVVILLLLQMGGLGIMTVSNWMLRVLGRRQRGLQAAMVLDETYGTLPHIEPLRLLRNIITFTIVCETIGTAILFARFSSDYQPPRALWLACFHAVSAFCNAGFSLFSDSLVRYCGDVVVNLTVMSLIIAGGLGFIVFSDLGHTIRRANRGRFWRSLSLHTRVVLTTTLLLIVAGAAVIMLIESNNSSTLGAAPVGKKFMSACFLSVTSRTAGFNTLPTESLCNTTLLVVAVLMLIGASPGSTGGGMKTTTAAILVGLLRARIRNRPRVEMFGRSVPNDLVAKALATAAAFLIMIVAAVVALQFIEFGAAAHKTVGDRLLEHLFEVVSAMGTVGLTTGITSALKSASKVVIIICMFVGRLGPLLLAASLVGQRRTLAYTLPEDRIMVG